MVIPRFAAVLALAGAAVLACEAPIRNELPGFSPTGPVLVREAEAVAPYVVGDFKLWRVLRPFDLPCCARILYGEERGSPSSQTLSITIRPRSESAKSLTEELASAHRRASKLSIPLDLPDAIRTEIAWLGSTTPAAWSRFEGKPPRNSCGIDILVAAVGSMVIEARHACPTEKSREAMLAILAAFVPRQATPPSP